MLSEKKEFLEHYITGCDKICRYCNGHFMFRRLIAFEDTIMLIYLLAVVWPILQTLHQVFRMPA